jgi:hypothetical protein
MPGETFQTLKSKATQQAKQSGMSQSAAENYGSAMASQAAQVGGAVVPNPSGGGTFNPEFFGGDQNTMADIGDDVREAISGSTAAPLEQIAARKEAEKKMQDAGGVFNPQTGMVEYPQQTNIFGGLGSLNVNDIIDKIPSLTLKGIVGGAKGLQLLLDKAFKPQLEDFSNPNFLAVLDAAFKSGKLNKDEYTKKYEDLLDDVYGDQSKDPEMQTKLLEEGIGSLDSESLFDLAMEQATEGVLPGSGTQRITDPKGFYLDDGKGILPQTTGGLANLAGLDVNQFTSGPGYNQKMIDMIFAARAELDRMGKDSSGNPQGGGSTGIPSLYAGPITPSDPNAVFNKPAIKYPEGYGAFLLNPPPPVRPGSPTQPGFPDQDGDGIDDRYQPGPGLPRPGIESIGFGIGSPKIPGDKMNIPAALNYANIAPQFTGYTNQGVSPAFLENLRRFYG